MDEMLVSARDEADVDEDVDVDDGSSVITTACKATVKTNDDFWNEYKEEITIGYVNRLKILDGYFQNPPIKTPCAVHYGYLKKDDAAELFRTEYDSLFEICCRDCDNTCGVCGGPVGWTESSLLTHESCAVCQREFCRSCRIVVQCDECSIAACEECIENDSDVNDGEVESLFCAFLKSKCAFVKSLNK